MFFEYKISYFLLFLGNGDETYVGDRGVTLSGGQKARVGLARAIYVDADLYLLDDPLAAVDPAVASRIFIKCINGFLSNKARILVTHQHQFLRNVEKILMLENGNQIHCGSFNEILDIKSDFVAKIKATLDESDEKTKV